MKNKIKAWALAGIVAAASMPQAASAVQPTDPWYAHRPPCYWQIIVGKGMFYTMVPCNIGSTEP